MRTTTDLLGVGYLKEVKKRRNNKSHLLNTGVKLSQKVLAYQSPREFL